MSYMNRPHSKELTQSLKDHGLDTKRPSQLSDAFRLGWWASEKEISKQRDELMEALKCCLKKGSRWNSCDPIVVKANKDIANAEK